MINEEIGNKWITFNFNIYIVVGPFSVQPGQNQMQNYNNLVNQVNINSF